MCSIIPNENLLPLAVRKRLLAALRRIEATPLAVTGEAEQIQVNPALKMIDVPLAGSGSNGGPGAKDMYLVWRAPVDGAVRAQLAGPGDLLALKIVLEEISAEAAAREAGVPVGRIDAYLLAAAAKGLLIMPQSRLRRPASWLPAPGGGEEQLVAKVFTLQWHITQECDLHCRHCYDRSSQRAFKLRAGLDLLDDLHRFCAERFVRGQVSLSGGNPLLHPEFMAFYRGAVDRGLTTAILGNPAPRELLAEIVAIQPPAYFQVSLEGLEQHNDHIRGAGHFRRTLAFLDLLRDMGVSSEVMLTLTRDNLADVLPLGNILRDKTDAFSFNRLALFGEGADLALPEQEVYDAFLADYVAAMADNPVFALKDNLLNGLLARQGRELFSGCAGFGCGAAFNFMAVLANGEVHACRKYPSPVGSVHEHSLAELYDSPAAERYRSRSRACRGCALQTVCGGCPAVTAGKGLDPLTDRDPLCFSHVAK
jgi:selenobiotic family peptide radical SAM maturase